MSISQTTVRFLKGVPFDNSYSHTRWFTSRTEQYNYFTNFPNIQRTQNNFQKSTGRMAIDVSEHVHVMMGYDYLMYKNEDYSGKWFYAFILNVEHISRGTTRVYFEIDPIQTYMFDVDFQSSYVVREHEDTNSGNVYPESLQIGSEYQTVHTWDVKPYPFYFMVVVTKDLIHEKRNVETSGSQYGVVDPLNYYFLPIPRNTDEFTKFYEDDRFGTPESLYGGSLSATNLTAFLKQSQKAVNNVVSIYLTDYLPLDITHLQGGNWQFDNTRLYTLEKTIDSLEQGIFKVDQPLGFSNFDFPDRKVSVGNVFSVINETHPKLRYSPYTVIEVSDARGNNVAYKPEGFLNTNGQLDLRVFGGLTHYNTVAYGLQGYFGNTDRAGVLDNALINTDPQDMAILTNQTASYLQGSKNSMQAKQNTWASQRLYQQTSSGIGMARSAGNLVGGGVGMAMGSLNLGYGINMLSTGLGNMAQSGVDMLQAGIDYQMKIQEQNAVVEDLLNVPPSLQKQGNNPSFNIGYNMQGVRVRVKRIMPQYLIRVRNYLHMFGTKVNQLKQPNLRTRTHFNYIQTSMLNVQSPIYNDDIIRFKYIFDQGITLWHTDDMYNYNVLNGKR